MAKLSKEKETVFNYVDKNEKWLSDFHQEIWSYGEPAWREYKSARAYEELLRKEGFKVEEGSGQMPTAFCAVWGKGKPVLASYAEYDAVPGHSQKAVPYKAPRDGLHPMAAGHTDPHSALGVGALFGILATKKAMEEHGIKGTLKFFGEPAEKVCGSKPVHAAKGYFDDLDASICYHPGGANYVRGEVQGGSYWSVLFQFECVDAMEWYKMQEPVPYRSDAHAGGRVPAALDAVCLMYLLTKDTKEAMLPHTAYWTVNEFVMIGGQCTSDNIPPKISQIQYAYRAPDLAMQKTITNVLENNARSVGKATFCKVYERWVTKTRVGLPNLVMANLTYENLELVGPPVYGDEAKEFARKIQENMGEEPMVEPLSKLGYTYGAGASTKTILSPKDMDEGFRNATPHWVKNMGSDDYVDYTWHAPSSRFFTARAALAPLPSGSRYPGWAMLAMGGNRSTIDPCMLVAAKTIGATFVDLLTNPNLLKKAKEEFEDRTGGGIGGSKWVEPLLPKDFYPPVDLRWPEYINTIRGEEWWIPTVKGAKEFIPL